MQLKLEHVCISSRYLFLTLFVTELWAYDSSYPHWQCRISLTTTDIICKGYVAHDWKLMGLHRGDTSQFWLEPFWNVQNMKMKISNPRFFIPGSLEDLNKGFPSCLEAHTSSGRKNAQPNVLERSNSLLFSFPSVSTELWFVVHSVAIYWHNMHMYIHVGVRENTDTDTDTDTLIFIKVFIYLFYLCRILQFVGEQRFPGLFGFILHFLARFP